MKGILNIGKYIVAVAAIAGAALFFDDFKDTSRERDEQILEIVEYNSTRIQDLQDTLGNFEREHREQGKQIKSLAWGLNHIEQFTPEDFEDIMNEMLNKQNGYSSGEVVFIPIQ